MTQSGWQITMNHPKTISDWFANHQESPRIAENHTKTIS